MFLKTREKLDKWPLIVLRVNSNQKISKEQNRLCKN